MSQPALKRIAVSLAIIAVTFALAGWLFGPVGYPFAAAAGLLLLAVRHDNRVGACLSLAVLFLVIIGVLLCLFYLILLVHH